MRAAELSGRGGWLGVQRPLSMARLRGRAVLVVFWAPSSVECRRLVPYLHRVVAEVGDDLVVVAVHAPRFPAEARRPAVVEAVGELGIADPVLDDSDLATWNAYGARRWPTVVLVTPAGEVVGAVDGPGAGPLLEKAVTEMLEDHAGERGKVRRKLPPVDRLLPPAGPLAFPGKVACSADGRRIAVADTAHDQVLVCSLDGTVLEAHTGFLQPQGVRFDGDGVVVCDTLADRVVRTDGEVLADSVGAPWDLVADGGSWVIAEAAGNRLVRVRPGEMRVRLVAGTGAEGTADGAVDRAELAQPSGVARTRRGLVFVDATTCRLRMVADDRLGAAVDTLAGDEPGHQDGSAVVARLQFPLGVAADPAGDGPVYVTDTYNDALRVWEDGALRTLPVPGLCRPGGLDLLPDGRLVVADTGNHRIVIVDPATAALTPVEIDETWVHGDDGPAVRLAPGRSVGIRVGIDLVDEQLDHTAPGPVHVTLSCRPADLLAGGGASIVLDEASGSVEVTGGWPGSGLLLVEVVARTVGKGGPGQRVHRTRHLLDVDVR
ncbi:MAG TPA: redoxin family protein [Acidimicrobiales bacterium]|nr:redoxin family protein [Acidimicrobiales bacterium]